MTWRHFAPPASLPVIYLSGPDTDPDGAQLPEHASRFWIYPGADAGAARWVAQVLAVKWSLTWQPVSPAHQDVA